MICNKLVYDMFVCVIIIVICNKLVYDMFVCE